MTRAHAPAWLPQGTVYGTLLNFQREFQHWAPKMTEAPYKGAPKAPVLYVKTANTFAPGGAAVAVGAEVWVGATLGLVIGAELTSPSGLPGVAGLVLLNDLSLPHDSYYRPAIRYRNRDGFLVCGAARMTPPDMNDLEALQIELRINGALRQTVDLSTLVRDASVLLRDVSAFMTLHPGDVLMLGTDGLAHGVRPMARAGDRIEISAPGFAQLVHTLVEDVQ